MRDQVDNCRRYRRATPNPPQIGSSWLAPVDSPPFPCIAVHWLDTAVSLAWRRCHRHPRHVIGVPWRLLLRHRGLVLCVPRVREVSKACHTRIQSVSTRRDSARTPGRRTVRSRPPAILHRGKKPAVRPTSYWVWPHATGVVGGGVGAVQRTRIQNGVGAFACQDLFDVLLKPPRALPPVATGTVGWYWHVYETDTEPALPPARALLADAPSGYKIDIDQHQFVNRRRRRRRKSLLASIRLCQAWRYDLAAALESTLLRHRMALLLEPGRRDLISPLTSHHHPPLHFHSCPPGTGSAANLSAGSSWSPSVAAQAASSGDTMVGGENSRKRRSNAFYAPGLKVKQTTPWTPSPPVRIDGRGHVRCLVC